MVLPITEDATYHTFLLGQKRLQGLTAASQQLCFQRVEIAVGLRCGERAGKRKQGRRKKNSSTRKWGRKGPKTAEQERERDK